MACFSVEQVASFAANKTIIKTTKEDIVYYTRTPRTTIPRTTIKAEMKARVTKITTKAAKKATKTKIKAVKKAVVKRSSGKKSALLKSIPKCKMCAKIFACYQIVGFNTAALALEDKLNQKLSKYFKIMLLYDKREDYSHSFDVTLYRNE